MEIMILFLVTAKDFIYLTYTMMLTGRRKWDDRRRKKIISILVVSGHITSMELVQEFSVTRRTILHDITTLSNGYPVYTNPENTKGFLM